MSEAPAGPLSGRTGAVTGGSGGTVRLRRASYDGPARNLATRKPAGSLTLQSI